MTSSSAAPARRGRSHPPALLKLAERALRDEAPPLRGTTVLAACSGGPDSTALLHVLALLRDRLGFGLVAHGVDHGLRAEAAAELALVADLAARADVPFEVTRVDVGAGAGLQARAREARYAALAAAAARAGAASIATGHTADDRAETWLMRLLRGAGPRGLAVLPVSAPLPESFAAGLPGGAPRLLRPLVRARRAAVLAHLARHGLPFASDPSNEDPRFLRVRVRRELVPLLEDLAPGAVEAVCALSDMLERMDELPGLEQLGRAQRQAVARARSLGKKSVELRLRGGRRVDVTFPDGQAVLTEKA